MFVAAADTNAETAAGMPIVSSTSTTTAGTSGATLEVTTETTSEATISGDNRRGDQRIILTQNNFYENVRLIILLPFWSR